MMLITYLLVLMQLMQAERLPAEEMGRLVVEIEDIQEERGSIRVALFADAKTFKDQKPSVADAVVHDFSKQQHRLELGPLAYGEYAIALYHDLNDNKELDTNTLGIPTEPFAFSNNPKVKWKSPGFRDTRFHFSKDQQVIEVRLQKWKAF